MGSDASCYPIHLAEAYHWAYLDAEPRETPASGLNIVTAPNRIAADRRGPGKVRSARPDLPPSRGRHLLMFSGGRDSTLAAIRMARNGLPVALVTVSSSHLIGIQRVRARLTELAKRLDNSTPWLRVRQPTELRTDTSFYERTCLPCHHAYVVVSGALARSLGTESLAFGYASYQRDWPEQTPFAIHRLAAVLERHGIELELPVYGVISKEAAAAELSAFGLSADALEQKCLRQVSNAVLTDAQLRSQVELWENAIDCSFTHLDEINFEILERGTLGDFR